MIAQIASIQHNGTQFLIKLLKDNDVDVNAIGHLTDSLDYSNWDNIICPLRHPRDVAESWGKRGKDYGWDEIWPRLIGLPAHFFFLDDRERALARLSKHLGIDLVTDWTPENQSTEPYRWIISESQILAAIEIYERLRP